MKTRSLAESDREKRIGRLGHESWEDKRIVIDRILIVQCASRQFIFIRRELGKCRLRRRVSMNETKIPRGNGSEIDSIARSL